MILLGIQARNHAEDLARRKALKNRAVREPEVLSGAGGGLGRRVGLETRGLYRVPQGSGVGVEGDGPWGREDLL